MPPANALRPKSITRIEGDGAAAVRTDLLAVEEPLEIRVAGRSVAVVMRTPGHDRELAAGFLVTEGIVQQRDDVIDIIRCGASGGEPSSTGNIMDAILARNVTVDFTRLTRHVFTSSSCGLCSKASIEAVRAQFPPIARTFTPSRRVLTALPERLRAAQTAFAGSGGVHASALFTAEGTLVSAHEDVGRHNALDKVIGEAFLADTLPLADRILLVSGRVSFELMQKALAAQIAAVVAISAPTTAAVEFAEANGQTLVGFLRPAAAPASAAATGPARGAMRMNVYAGTLAE